MKHRILFSLFAAIVASACSSTTTSSSSSGGSRTRAKTGAKICPPLADAGANACTQQQEDEYDTCVLGTCEEAYIDGAGPDYASGSFSGKCKSYFSCVEACACNDAVCTTSCAQNLTSDAACLAATQSLAACIKGSNCKKTCS
jgi:hypothetical protein